jgi:multicomponent Na+:H+ antiporter subunit E
MCIFFLSVITYLFLAWSGDGISLTEVVIALLLGGVLFLVERSFFGGGRSMGLGASLVRGGRFLHYFFGPFMVALAKANVHVAKLVITGKIRPGIVKVPAEGLGDGGITLLANSITLTPGTLSVDVDEDDRALYVHCIDLSSPDPDPKEIYGSFADWARRITQ